MAKVGQGMIGDPQGIEILCTPPDGDDDNEIIIGGAQPLIGGSEHPIMILR